MDAIGPNLPGCPLEYGDRLRLILELDPDSALYQYITWLEDELLVSLETNEKLNRELSKHE